MAVAMLIAGGDAEPVLGPGAAQSLATLGITRVSLLADGAGIGVVLEGWAFDAAYADEAIRALFPDANQSVRVLHEIEHVAVRESHPTGRL